MPVDKANPEGVEAYLAKIDEPHRTTLMKVRAIIRSAAPPEAVEDLSYGMPAFRYKGALVSYAAFKEHCSLFPMSLAVMDEFKIEISAYSSSKGGIRFPSNKPISSSLLRKIVKARVAENERRRSK